MSSPTPPDKKSQKELSNEVRMLIAFALMGGILLATPWVYRKLGVAPPPADSKTQSAPKNTSTDPSTATAGGAPITPSATPAPDNAEPSAPLAGAISAPG